jgi:prepilin-type N-terminal cleavage/methylation domain-containing protein/prepilin-type processing-associated H-X9-DG protein
MQKVLKGRSRFAGRQRAFTLIELLIVIAIIGIIAAILFPVFSRARENARRANCASNMKQVGLGIAQYVQDYDERMPKLLWRTDPNTTVNNWWQACIQPYVKSTQVFHCPSITLTYTTNLMVAAPDLGIAGFPSNYMGAVLGTSSAAFSAQTKPNAAMFAGLLQPPTSMADVTTPATTISLFEIRKAGNYAVPDYASQIFKDWLFAGHLSTGNYLYADGHVKALRPLATVADGVNQWTRDNSQNGASTTTGCNYTRLKDEFLQNAADTYH